MALRDQKQAIVNLLMARDNHPSFRLSANSVVSEARISADDLQALITAAKAQGGTLHALGVQIVFPVAQPIGPGPGVR